MCFKCLKFLHKIKIIIKTILITSITILLIRILSKTPEKEVLQGNILDFFLLAIKAKVDTIRAFLSKIRTLFWFSKREGEAPPLPPSSSPVSGALNMSKYPWKYLNNLLYVEYRICLIIAGYASIMLEYASIYLNVPQYARIWLNITKCLWICLKMLE